MTKKELKCLKERAELNNIQERSGVTIQPLNNKGWRLENIFKFFRGRA